MDIDTPSAAPSAAASAAPRGTPRKPVLRDPTARRRTARLACDFCHKKKTKCDGSYPCSNCKKRHIDCLWAGGAPVNLIAGSYTPEYVKWLEEKVSALSGSTKTVEEARSRVAAIPSQEPRFAPADVSSPSAAEFQRQQTSPRYTAPDEVAGVNQHTNDQEFYGSSSSVAILARVGRSPSKTGDDLTNPHPDDPVALLTSLHNPFFTRGRAGGEGVEATGSSLPSFPQCKMFLDDFFSTLHYIFPILGKALFMRRCEDLWTSEDSAVKSSFVALYFSVLSLGALVGPRSDELIGGLDNLTWSRKFFDESRTLCSALGMVTDLEMVQCYFFLSKVCQNELNPHLTYMYVGLAVRTALAIGINRSPPDMSKKDPEVVKAETRTWWGLYSLETELSFGMGRPDTLGADLYHNRPFPVTTYSYKGTTATGTGHELLESAQVAILEFMVDFSRIIRRIRLGLYVPQSPATVDLGLALQCVASIEQDLDRWLGHLPQAIRPLGDSAQDTSLRGAKVPQYVKKQKLVLTIRYHNIRILLFGSFLLRATNGANMTPAAQQYIQKCLDSAKETIDIIYDTYRHHDFFRTWFYNTTYTVFASSMILLYMAQAGDSTELQRLSRYVEMAVEILEVMDESVIAVKSAGLIKRALDRVKASAPPVAPAGPDVDHDLWLPAHHYWGSVNLLDGQLDESFPFQLGSWSE